VRIYRIRSMARESLVGEPRAMPRPLRVHDPGSYRHVTARGNDRMALFHDDEDRRRFLDILARITREQPWRCLA